MRTTTLILGLIAATMLLFGGACGYVFGSAAESFEDAFDVDVSESKDGVTSTTEDVSSAGGFAVFVAIFLYVGAGLAKVAFKTSTVLLSLCVVLIIMLVVVDTTSLFAVFYYLALVLTAVGVILMSIAHLRSKRMSNTNTT